LTLCVAGNAHTAHIAEISRLQGDLPELGDNLGSSVSISGTTAVVGASLRDDLWGEDSGAAFIIVSPSGGPWQHYQKLVAGTGSSSDQFGASAALINGFVVIGAPTFDSLGPMTGAAFVFARNDAIPAIWYQQKRLLGSDSVSGDLFGMEVALSGDTAVVGAQGAGSGTGAAYVFERDHGGADQWGQVRKLTASDGQVGDLFGCSVAVTGDTVLVGSCEAAGGGAVYVFGRDEGGTDNWGEVDKLTPSGAAAGEGFGASIAVSSRVISLVIYQYAVIGAPYISKGEGSGAAYVFRSPLLGTSWSQRARLLPSDTSTDEMFGASVAMSGSHVVVAAGPLGGTPSDTYGSAYLYSLASSDVSSEVARFIPSVPDADENAGISLAVSGDAVLVGGPGIPTTTGTLYVTDYQLVFADGFERGDTTAWSAALP